MRSVLLILLLSGLASAGPSEFDLGLKAFQSGSFDAAKAHFEAYLKTDPSKNLPRTLFYLGQLEADGQKSQNYYQALATRFPKDTLASRAGFLLGQMAYAKADYAQARLRFAKTLAQFPGLAIAAEAQYWLGVCSLVEGRPEEARREFYALLKGYPQSPRAEWAKLGIGDSYVKQANYSRALTEYQDYEALYPSGEALPIALFQAGQCYESLNGKEEALATYRRVIEVAPQGYEAIRSRQRMAALGKAGRDAPKPISNFPIPNPIPVVRSETTKAVRDSLSIPPLLSRDTASLASGIYLQVAAYLTSESTSPLKEKLAKGGYPATTSTKMVSGRKYYTVLVGPYPSDAQARAAEARLKSEQGVSPLWIRR